MIVKILICVLIWNSNFSDGFPLENFSIDFNKTDSHEFGDIKGNNDSQTESDFELIHENDDGKKIVKKRNANEQNNSAENHIHHKDNHGHHSKGFSYKRPSNVPKESAESHHIHATEKHTKKTTIDTEHSGENSTTIDKESKESTTVIRDQDESSITASHQTPSNHPKTHSTTSSSKDENHIETDHIIDSQDSTVALTVISKNVETTEQSVEPNLGCDDSGEIADENLTKKVNNSSKTNSKTTKSVHKTTNKEESKEDDNKSHGNPANHSKNTKTSDHPNHKSTNFLKSSTESFHKTTKVHNVTESSINPVLHHTTSPMAATSHDLSNSTLSAVNSTEKFANSSKTAHVTQTTHTNHKNSHHNTKSNSSHDSNYTTSHDYNHNSTPKHNHPQKSSTSLPHTKNPSNHKIIHSHDTTHFDEWAIGNKDGKIESHEDNKVGFKHDHKQSTIHHDAANIETTLKRHHLTTILHHESNNNHVHDQTVSTTDHDMHKVRFAIPREAHKQNQGMKNEENSKFDHNQLDDVEIFKMTEKSMTVAGKRQTDKHVIKFVG